MSFSKPWRPYQKEADKRICLYFETKNRILVKMFCGTGKSLIMRDGKAFQNHSLCVYVFPSLSLINQFDKDYLQDVQSPLLIVSSDEGHTTNEEDIQTFLKQRENKILCITYQSFELIKDIEIPMCVLDEAHHVTSETYQPLFLENTNIQRMCLFTATPKKSDTIDYGETVYEYSYLRGVAEGYLNPFEIRVDLVGENSNKIIYESIARTYFTTGNNRILTFHADVNTESPTSVRNFVNQIEIQKAFETIQKEFPSQPIPNIHVRGFYSEMKSEERRALLKTFDASQDVFILSSCETMGEGVDTKNANICVFVDPKSSFVKIIQNIGRIVRKEYEKHKPHSTILLPIYIDKTKYESCTTAEECDEAIRKDMASGGDFTAILNVLSALKQEDEDLYEICLHYPNEYSPQEIEENLRTQGYTIGEQVDIDEVLERVEEEDVQVDVHTNSLETPIITHGESEQVINILQQGDEYFEIQGEEKKIQPPKERVKMTVHTNPDVKVFWKLQGELNLGSCLMDCEVIDNWNERLEESQNFLEKEKRIPNEKSTNLSEKILGKFISHQKQNYKNDKMSNERKIKWEEFVKYNKEKYNIAFSYDDLWDKNLQYSDEFILLNKRRPNSNSTNKDEKNSANFIYTNITGSNKHKKEPEWLQFYEKHKQYFQTNEDKLYKKLNELTNFMDINGRRPIQEVADKDEDRLARFLARALKGLIKMNTQQQIDFEQITKKYAKYLKEDNEKIWEKQAEQYNQFIKINNRRPTEKDNKDLNSWGRCQVTSYNQNKMESERKIKWEKLVEEHKEHFKSSDQIWEDTFKTNQKFIYYYKRKPIRMSKCNCNTDFPHGDDIKNCETCSCEYKLAQWSCDSDKKYEKNKMIPKHKKMWEEYKGYLTTPKKSMKRVNFVMTEPTESTEQKRHRVKSELSVLHQHYKTMRSDTLAQHFKDNPDAWCAYHAISEANEESFPTDSIPRNQIIRELDKIKTRRPKQVVDMGCGMGFISKHFMNDSRFKFTNIDHVAINETVQVGDISKLPFENDSQDICILSLAMWGSNCKEYIQEAHRVLETNGTLYIIEPTKRWTETEPADRLIELLKEFHIRQITIEKFTFIVAIK